MRKPVVCVRARALTTHALPPHDLIRLNFQKTLPPVVYRHTVRPAFRFLRKTLIYRGSWDLVVTPFSTHVAYRNMLDLRKSLPDHRQSAWYKRAMQELRESGVFFYKKHRAETPEEVDSIFRTVLVPLLETMNATGYRRLDGDPLPDAMIGRAGELIKTHKGRHRLAAAQLADRETIIPLRIIAIHRDWWDSQCLPTGARPRDEFGEALRLISLRYGGIA